jgi:hypothetical protein
MEADAQLAVDGLGRRCLASDLVATGDRFVAASTRKGNAGGQSVQEGFIDRDGRPVTRHTVYDSSSRIIHGPHFRPGRFT